MDALRVLSVELHFIYEVLHTKALAIRPKWSYVFRFIAFIDVVTAFAVFNRLKKHQLAELDVKITYLLLFGGIPLDVIAVLMLVFSNWTIAEIQWYKTRSSKLDPFLHNLVSAADYVMKPPFPTCEAELNTKVTYGVLDTPLIFRRWSESISACNLLSESFEKSPRKMYKCDWRWGNIAFSKICGFPFYMAEKTISYFHQAIDTITRGCGMGNTNGKRSMIANTREDPAAGNDEREFSKILSDYMMYLLLNQPNVVSAVAGIAQMRSATTLRELQDRIDTEDVKSFCEAIFPRNAEEADGHADGMSLLEEGISMARRIEKLGERKWRVMSGVWVEMLTYAAGHIKGEAHAQVLSSGGELLAFVWLLMIHFGIVYRPEWGPYYIIRSEEGWNVRTDFD